MSALYWGIKYKIGWVRYLIEMGWQKQTSHFRKREFLKQKSRKIQKLLNEFRINFIEIKTENYCMRQKDGFLIGYTHRESEKERFAFDWDRWIAYRNESALDFS